MLPFALDRPDQFRAPPPPALASPEYALAFDEVKRLGGDGVATATERSEEQTFVGIFWAYDGTPSLCAPPRLYNQLAVQIAAQERTRGVELARLLALANAALADAGIAVWESKYFHDFWRPIAAIREADPGGGPTGAGDGNDATAGDPDFTPLGAPASNLPGTPDFTPPFPAHPSGHAGFGGALFETLRNFYGRDDIAFRFVSDEWNGETLASDGSLRPLVPRSFASLSQAEEENGQSRIYLGIHFSFTRPRASRSGAASRTTCSRTPSRRCGRAGAAGAEPRSRDGLGPRAGKSRPRPRRRAASGQRRRAFRRSRPRPAPSAPGARRRAARGAANGRGSRRARARPG